MVGTVRPRTGFEDPSWAHPSGPSHQETGVADTNDEVVTRPGGYRLGQCFLGPGDLFPEFRNTTNNVLDIGQIKSTIDKKEIISE